ncbi:MAG: dockerin type I domain-containing protein, partial [Bacteroidota bacterium]
SDLASKAFADNQVMVDPGVYAVYAADINQDGYVDSFDYSLWETDNLSFASGYFATDINGDGFVDGFDYTAWEANNLSFISLVTP